MTEVMPQTIPNMVKKLRSFVSQRAESVCLSISWKGMNATNPWIRIRCLSGLRKNEWEGSLMKDVHRECVSMEQVGWLQRKGPDGEIGRHSGLKIRRP